MSNDEIRAKVLQGYGEVATQGKSCCGPSPSCCSDPSKLDTTFNEALGYTSKELEALPEGANMNLSCGNPTALASLKEGEVVLDLGSGGGLDVFLAAQKVGSTGKAIGVDMTPEMLHKARNNNVKFKERSGLSNVEFRLGEIEHLPVADSSVDVIISNCVINLSPDKEQVWREIGRVLKPGGRACISDLALLRPLPDSLKESIHALVGCVNGAVPVEDTVGMVKAAGLVVETMEKKSVFMEQLESSDDPNLTKVMELIPEGLKPRDYVTSLDLVVKKP